MAELTPADPFPDEIFYRIFEIEDHVERTQFVEALRNRARILKRSREFSSVLQSFFKDYQQKMMERGNVTQFTEQPIELQCGPWKATDLGVTMQKFDSRGMPVQLTACMHPILPIEILKNVDTGEERVRLAYFKYGTWNQVTVNREVCADNTMIVKVLSKIGVEVTSENAKYLVRYISDCIGMNPAKLAPTRSINRLGWCGNEFMPYADDIVYDGELETEIQILINNTYKKVSDSIERGSFRNAIQVLFELVNYGNKYYDLNKPWITRTEDPKICGNTLFNCIQIIANLAVMFHPFTPESSSTIEKWLGIDNKWAIKEVPTGWKIPKVTLLYERIDKKRVNIELDRLKGSGF